jgi:predicted NAD/FAD-dependent oxidoreductase
MTLVGEAGGGKAGGPIETAVAVVGAGMAGAACAATLAQAGIGVALLDKGRGPGGRMATRRVTFPDAAQIQVDHGAQYFTARAPAFRSALAGWMRAGAAAEWPARIGTLSAGHFNTAISAETRYVGQPRMSALAAHIAGPAARYGIRVAALERSRDGWRLLDEDGNAAAIARVVALAVPAPQAAELLGAAPRLREAVGNVETAPCWAIMLGFPHTLPVPFDGAFVADSALRWVARDSSKPGRAPLPEAWVGHATPEWSAGFLEESPDAVAAALEPAFHAALGVRAAPFYVAAHRWRYALTTKALGEPCLWDEATGLGACGDWCLGPRIEAGWTSGALLGARILARLRPSG